MMPSPITPAVSLLLAMSVPPTPSGGGTLHGSVSYSSSPVQRPSKWSGSTPAFSHPRNRLSSPREKRRSQSGAVTDTCNAHHGADMPGLTLAQAGTIVDAALAKARETNS